MRVIFLGTPEFSVKVIDAINNSNHTIVGVVTQPDKANARGKKVVFSKVKEYALNHNLPLYQFNKISIEGEEILRELNADIMVTSAYGQILRQNILDLTPKGIINVHASLLPKYRGSSPVQWSLINGEEEIGVTIMQTELGIDTGDIILAKSVKLNGDENCAEALELLSGIGAEIVVDALDMIENNTATYVKQDAELSSHCKMIAKSDALLDFSKSAKEVHNFIRGMNPSPCAFTNCANGVLKVHRSEVCETEFSGGIGEVVVSDPKIGLIVCCGEGAINLKVVQGENAKAMDIRSYLLGKKIEKGSILG